MLKISKVDCTDFGYVNPIAPRKAKIAHNFGLSECNRVN